MSRPYQLILPIFKQHFSCALFLPVPAIDYEYYFGAVSILSIIANQIRAILSPSLTLSAYNQAIPDRWAMPILAEVFLRDESGATAIEYAMIACFIFLAITGAVALLGGNLTSVYGQIAAAF